MKYQKEYDEIRVRNKELVTKEKVDKLISLKMQLKDYALRGHSRLFDQAMDEIKQLEEELENEYRSN